jgi:hypothetical protein
MCPIFKIVFRGFRRVVVAMAIRDEVSVQWRQRGPYLR